MGMDGLSFSNTGAIKEQTSAEYTNKVEQSMAMDPSNNAQYVDSLANNQRVKEKEESEEGSGKKKREGKQEQTEFQDGLVETPSEEETEEEFHVEDFENPEKEFYVNSLIDRIIKGKENDRNEN